MLLLQTYLFQCITTRDIDYEYSVYLLILITSLYLPLIYNDGYNLIVLKWDTQSYNTISSTKPYFYYKLAYMGLVYSTAGINFGDKPVEYSIIFMICGGYLVVLFAYIQPYVQLIVNYIQCLKGAALFLAGLIMLIFSISDTLDQASYAATITFFLVMPFLSLFIREIMTRRRNYVLKSLNLYSKAFECFIKIQEHRHERYIMLPDADNFMSDIIHIQKAQKRNFYVHIWVLYYLLDAENLGGVCLFLSKIRKLTVSIQQMSYVKEFKEEYYKVIRQNKEIEEAVEFLFYHRRMQALSKSDKICYYTFIRIYEQLATSRDVHTLSRFIVKFIRVFKEAKEAYNLLIKSHQNTSEVLHSYLDFIKTIENTEFKENEMILRELNNESRHIVRNSSSSINSEGLVMVVSLKKKSLGYLF